jgi:hypothetical protein
VLSIIVPVAFVARIRSGAVGSERFNTGPGLSQMITNVVEVVDEDPRVPVCGLMQPPEGRFLQGHAATAFAA